MISREDINVRRRTLANGSVEYYGMALFDKRIMVNGSVQPMQSSALSIEEIFDASQPPVNIRQVDTEAYDPIMTQNLQGQVHDSIYKKPRLLVNQLISLALSPSPMQTLEINQIVDKLRRMDFI